MEPKLIEIKKVHPVTNNISNVARKVIFAGDTHGDLEASQKVIKDYLKTGNIIVFLGDYVDRGPSSKENLDFLLKIKGENPNQIYLLQGNHEGHHILKFSPAEFWEGLSDKEYERYCSIVEKFPLIVVAGDIISLHGVLPNCPISDIDQIKIGDENWFQICWGDYYPPSTLQSQPTHPKKETEKIWVDPFTGRPQFGRDYFFKLMERFGKKVLIRSHQPDAPLFMFDDRCLTIFTSSAYTRERTIAIADLTKEIKTARDLEILKI